MSNASAHDDTSLFRNKVYMLEIIVLFEYGNTHSFGLVFEGKNDNNFLPLLHFAMVGKIQYFLQH